MLSPDALALLRWIAASDSKAPPPAGDLTEMMAELLEHGAIDVHGALTPLGRSIAEPSP